MKTSGTPQDIILRTFERPVRIDPNEQIRRRMAVGALLQDSRLELEFDHTRGEYLLGVAAGC